MIPQIFEHMGMKVARHSVAAFRLIPLFVVISVSTELYDGDVSMVTVVVADVSTKYILVTQSY